MEIMYMHQYCPEIESFNNGLRWDNNVKLKELELIYGCKINTAYENISLIEFLNIFNGLTTS